ncbi:hypothetical protein T492DRAFT_885980, partial [Pavlovales sp. CCMP2436]
VYAYYDKRVTFGESLIEIGFFWGLFVPIFLVSFSITFSIFIALVGLGMHLKLRISH